MASIFANMSVSMDLIIFVFSIEFFGNGNRKFSVANKFDSYINVIVYLLLYETILQIRATIDLKKRTENKYKVIFLDCSPIIQFTWYKQFVEK